MIQACKLDTKGEWMVDNSHLYIPGNGVKIEHTNVAGSDTGRTEDGLMHIDWVRRDVTKVYLKWPTMTESELNYIIDLMQGKEFRFTYKDRGRVNYLNGYSGECSYTFYSDALHGQGIYTDVSINVIEI